MHGLLGLAGLIALVSLAFGREAGQALAQAIVIVAALAIMAVAYLVVFDKI